MGWASPRASAPWGPGLDDLVNRPRRSAHCFVQMTATGLLVGSVQPLLLVNTGSTNQTVNSQGNCGTKLKVISGWGCASTGSPGNIKVGLLIRESEMKFSARWIDGAGNASAEERATLCELEILVGKENACSYWDDREKRPYEWVTVPAVYLAEGIAADWWSIFGGRDVRHPIWRYRTGFILPLLSFSCRGAMFEVSGEELVRENPGVRFWPVHSELVARSVAEEGLSGFGESVVGRLRDHNIRGSEVELAWTRVSESGQDLEERAFCEAAGALGVDPYSIADSDAAFIERAGQLFNGDALLDFLSGVRRVGYDWRYKTLNSIEQVVLGEGWSGHHPVLDNLVGEVKAWSGGISPGEDIWISGRSMAKECRDAWGVQDKDLTSVSAITSMLGFFSVAYVESSPGVSAVVSRGDGVRIFLSKYGTDETFFDRIGLARAIGDAVFFPGGGYSVVNGLRHAERQAVSRAFAAEFLAPSEKVMDMHAGGWDVDHIAGVFRISPDLIEDQIRFGDREYGWFV